MKRKENIDQIAKNVYDAVIVGGGITGAGIFEELSNRGYLCLLIEKNDFASGTSSNSAKLIHGGLRYLQYLKFGLVKESLHERNNLLNKYPNLVKPVPFVFPIYKSLLKYWAGMILYNILSGKSTLHRFKFLSKAKTIEKFKYIDSKGLKGSFLFYDGVTNDARLCCEVIHEIMKNSSSMALNYFELESIDDSGDHFQLNCKDHIENKNVIINTEYLINAGGAWVDQILQKANVNNPDYTAPSKGVQLVFDRSRLPMNQSFTFTSYAGDKQMFYTVPWENNTVILGITDTEYKGNPDDINITDGDIKYLLYGINCFAPDLKLTEKDILYSFVGLRPLIKDHKSSKERSRDFKVWWENDYIISILGGKLTTYQAMARKLADEFSKKHKPKYAELRNANESKVLANDNKLYYQYTIKQYHLITDILDKDKKGYEIIHPDFPICKAEIIYAIKYLSCHHLNDLIYRRTSIGYSINKSLFKEQIILEIAQLMKNIIGWTEAEYEMELNSDPNRNFENNHLQIS